MKAMEILQQYRLVILLVARFLGLFLSLRNLLMWKLM